MGLPLALVLAAHAGVPPEDPAIARLAFPLREARALHRRGEIDVFRFRSLKPLDIDGLSVVVVPGPGVERAAIVSRLGAAGFLVEAASRGAVQVWAPWERLGDLAAVEGVARVREPWTPAEKESVTEGYDAVMVEDWHALDVRGEGASVGILDIGFAGLDALAADELPADLETDFSRGSVDASSHGTAVTEVIHDFVPDAHFFLATFRTDVEFGEVIEAMVEAGIDVINGSIGFDNVWAADGTSSLTQYTDWAGEQGVLYVAAAGNENEKYRVGDLAYVGTDGVIALEGIDALRARSQQGFVSVSFRWSERFGDATEDIDLVVYNDDGSVCGQSAEAQAGDDDPLEEVRASGCSPMVDAVLYSESGRASLEGLEGYFYAYYGLGDDALRTDTEDLTLPGDTVSGVSVGAYDPGDDSVPDFSSRGPTNDGRTKPDLVAPSGVTTATYGPRGFSGSSAAAPHVTGLAALWVSASRRHGKGDEIKAWLLANARDLGEAGPDNVSGAGAARASAELPERCGCATGPRAAGWPLLAMIGMLASRRRRGGTS